MDSSSFPYRVGKLFLVAATAALLTTSTSMSTRADDASQQAGYHVGEPSDDVDIMTTTTDNTDAAITGDDAQNGPVRMARFSYIEGNVSWRPDSTSDWSDATVNLPLRQGAQIWVTGKGRAEVQFDDGSYARFGDSAVATLQSLYSDENGEFTEIRLNEGLTSLKLRNERSMYQVDTALGSVTADGPANIRVGSDSGLEVAIRDGGAKIETESGNANMIAGDYVYLPTGDDALILDTVPGEDAWDKFNDERDNALENPTKPCNKYLPASINIVAGNIDDYGDWRSDPNYGEVWCPRVSDPDWRPYEHGHWVWVKPFGWTWVAEEPWGWAPYHYGTWVRVSTGWAWVPGPAQQYWSPAVVHFTNCDGDIAWVALAPHEVHYPTVIDAGYRHGNWWVNFSVGGCAVYEPETHDYCAPRPWHNGDINCGRIKYPVRPIGPVDRITSPFIPRNSRRGVVQVASTEFGTARGYRHVDGNSEDVFRRGHSNGNGRSNILIAGPVDVNPTRESYTPTRSFNPGRPSPSRLDRPVYRARVPESVARNSDTSGQFVTGRQTGGGADGQLHNGQSWRTNPGGNPQQTTNGGSSNGRWQGGGGGTGTSTTNTWHRDAGPTDNGSTSGQTNGGGWHNGGWRNGNTNNGDQPTPGGGGWRRGTQTSTPPNGGGGNGSGWHNGGQSQPTTGGGDNGGQTSTSPSSGPAQPTTGWHNGQTQSQGGGGWNNGGQPTNTDQRHPWGGSTSTGTTTTPSGGTGTPPEQPKRSSGWHLFGHNSDSGNGRSRDDNSSKSSDTTSSHSDNNSNSDSGNSRSSSTPSSTPSRGGGRWTSPR